jgi:hypothetical protein
LHQRGWHTQAAHRTAINITGGLSTAHHAATAPATATLTATKEEAMEIRIIIENATPAVIQALAGLSAPKAVRAADAPPKKGYRWSRKAKMNLRLRTPEAPYGLKKDGTPRAKPGASKKVTT